MRVFICEFVTGGGMRRDALPASLAREGLLMRDALARDFSELPGVETVVTYDDRLPPPPGAESLAVEAEQDCWGTWAALAGATDLACIVAPETDGVLERLWRLCDAAGARVLGPDLAAIQISASKRRTAERLLAHGVPTPAVWSPDSLPAGEAGPFVSKPDDGAGCGSTRFWTDRPAPGALPPSHIVQRYQPGAAASLTCLGGGGSVSVLAANEQHVAIRDGVFRFNGLTVGAVPADREVNALAQRVWRAVPGLHGFFGIDLVRGPEGATVIEINPRVTTAYAGLREALGSNPAGLLGLSAEAPLSGEVLRPVEIAL
ncbi:ATP-grasp domain-containing protein [Hansschlegelia beijingensis]